MLLGELLEDLLARGELAGLGRAPARRLELENLEEDPPELLNMTVVYARLNEDEYQEASGAEDTPEARTTVLYQNQPNPFNPVTTINYLVGESAAGSRVSLTVFDAAGRVVRTLVDEVQGAGEHQAVWDGRDEGGRPTGSGLYLYRLDVGESRLIRKMILLK